MEIYCPTKDKRKIVDMTSKPAGDICPICEGYKKDCNFIIVDAKEDAASTPESVREKGFTVGEGPGVVGYSYEI